MGMAVMEGGTSLSAQAILLPTFASLSIVILIVPATWHWRLKNIGAVSLIFYLALANFFTLINAIIWPSEDYEHWWNGAGLCDIEVKLKWPYVTGLACATLCITRNLANVLNVDRQEIAQTRASKRRKTIVDISICFLVPFLQAVLHYIVQYNRYLIAAIGGCTESYDRSWPTIVIMFMWPPIFSLINCYYALAVIIRLRRYRANFENILSSSSSGLTASRFLRLFIMSFTLLLLYTPVCIYFLCVNLNVEWLSYDWNIIHDPETWWQITYLPAQGVRTFDRWVAIAMAFFVFAYFGLGGDAIDIYRKWMLKIGFGRLFPSLKGPRRQRVSRRDDSWFSSLSLLGKARAYFESSRKNSATNTFGTGSDNTSSFRKPSLVTVENKTGVSISLPVYPLSSYSSPQDPDTISPTTPLAPCANHTPRKPADQDSISPVGLILPQIHSSFRDVEGQISFWNSRGEQSTSPLSISKPPGTKPSLLRSTNFHLPTSLPARKHANHGRGSGHMNLTGYPFIKSELTTTISTSQASYFDKNDSARLASIDAQPEFHRTDEIKAVASVQSPIQASGYGVHVDTKIDRFESRRLDI